jgi:hypothetical protein
MKQNKENLLKLLNLVEEISVQEGNEWFLELLSSKFSENKKSTVLNPESIETKINLIKDYLSIDLNRVIDYSYFKEPTKESLFRDCLEMGRYEKGTPNHKINFGEFCRYAHLQAEEMINYFFNIITNNDINIIDQFIQEKVPAYKPTRKPSEVHHVFYTYKLTAFKSVSQLPNKYISIFYFLNEYRNELSHRNSMTISTENDDLSRFEKSGFLNSKIDFDRLDSKQKEIYNKGRFVINKREKNFDLIYDSLEELKKRIKDTLTKMQVLPISKSTIGNANPVLQEIKKKLEQEK